MYFDVADSPQGPWTTTAVLPVVTQGEPDETTTYFVSFVPSDENGQTIAISNNRWDGAFSDVYHPTFETIERAVWKRDPPVELSAGVWI